MLYIIIGILIIMSNIIVYNIGRSNGKQRTLAYLINSVNTKNLKTADGVKKEFAKLAVKMSEEYLSEILTPPPSKGDDDL